MKPKLKKIKLNAGDVFYFGIDDNSYIAGQIIYLNKFEIEVVIFDKLYAEINDIRTDQLQGLKPILIAFTLDSLFKHDRWQVLKNSTVTHTGINNFKVETPQGVYIADRDGKLLREANPEEINQLKYKKNISPTGISNAVKCYYKLIPFEEYYGNMFYTL